MGDSAGSDDDPEGSEEVPDGTADVPVVIDDEVPVGSDEVPPEDGKESVGIVKDPAGADKAPADSGKEPELTLVVAADSAITLAGTPARRPARMMSRIVVNIFSGTPRETSPHVQPVCQYYRTNDSSTTLTVSFIWLFTAPDPAALDVIP